MKELTKKELQKLKTKSKNWKEQEWEEYLKTLEHERSESLIHPRRYDKLREKNPFLWEDYSNDLNFLESLYQLKKLLNELTPKQRKVIKMIFWERLSEREIARKLGLSRNAVVERKNQGLQKVKKLLKAKTLSAPPYIGGKTKSKVFSLKPKPISSAHFYNPISKTKKGERHAS